ncbi:hypothetical protein LIER_38644 [Lithospermum erythrorhizon]|uniref:Transposase MuDR plant domain-containing protein n=1 Tax=Lithospermum erythrorhizon TaxID=34254 RepID=A0AAV3Q7K5_LITER
MGSELLSNESLKSLADSTDEEAGVVQQRKDIRYVKFNENDMQDPNFFVGLVFTSKKQVREVVTWYSVLHHKPLWLAANDNTRFAIKCKFPCTFSVWISRYCKLSPTDWVVKSVVRAHSGCPDERIALCNSRFLSKAMEGKFRMILEMDFAAVQVFVDQMFNVKISRNCARRTKESASKKINGDDRK